MKPTITLRTFARIILSICTIFIFKSTSYTQTSKDILASLDTTDFKGKPLLNKTIRTASFFDGFRDSKKKINAKKEVLIDLHPNYFSKLYTILEQADLQEKQLSNKLKTILARKGKELAENNAIPIGLVNTDSWLLSKEQLEANINAKKANKRVNKKDYELVNFIVAGLLQQEAYQSNVTFEIDPNLIVDNFAKNNAIKSLSFDFGDGKGFREYDLKLQSISYQFPRAGNYVIRLKLVTKQGTYISRNPFTVHFLQRPTVTTGSVSTNVSTPTVKGARTTASVSGADYAIHVGCDGIFDKPIIIAEGFDGREDIDLDYLSSHYLSAMKPYTNNGYDIVFVNYWNGRDWIQSNAQVLKRVIQEINAKKIAHNEENKLSIIGLSMSGLVARWALCEMERDNQEHEVSRLICYDTPNKGANTPPGISYAAADAADGGWSAMDQIALLAEPSLKSINSAAATQMLLFQNKAMTHHSNFDDFFTSLKAFGNDGYPTRCKNIAFVNGALNGTFNKRTTGEEIIPGDKIFDTDFIYYFCYDFIDCWTNKVNEDTRVYEEDAWGIPNPIFGIICKWGFFNSNITLPYNLDRLAGGYNVSIEDAWGQNTTFVPRFAFVPTFSAVDYKGSLVNDADYRLEIGSWLDANYQVRSDRQSLTPFKAIYGDSINNQHVIAETYVLRQMAIREFGIPSAFLDACHACGSSNGTGLKAQYYGNQDLQTNPQPLFTQDKIEMKGDAWQYLSGANLLANNISARWEGYLDVPITGTYTLNMRTDDGTRVWFDNVQKVNDWNDYPPTDHRFTVSLTAGQKYPIKIEWKQFGGGYEAKLLWSYNGVEGIVPQCHLYPLSYTPPPSLKNGDGTCYTIQSKATNKYMQLMSDGTIQQQNQNNLNNQKWKFTFNYIFSNDNYPLVSSGSQDYGEYLRTSGTFNQWVAVPFNGYYRVNTPNGTTWDMEGAGSQSHLQLYGSVNEGLADYRLWKITEIGCSITGQSTSPTPIVLANQYTINPGEAATLTASGCSGTIVWEDNITSGNVRNVYSAGTYSARCQNPGENISPAAFTTINQNTTPSNPCPNDEVAIGTLNGDEMCIKHWGSYYLYCQKYNYNGVLCYIPRGSNYLRDFAQSTIRYPNTEQFDACINTMETGWWGLANPLPDSYTPNGWSVGYFDDGTKYFYMSNGARKGEQNEEVVKNSLELLIAPNPTGGQTMLSFDLANEQVAKITFYDVLGSSIKVFEISGKAGKNHVPLDLSGFSTGMYFIRVETATEQSTKRVIKIE